MSFDNLKFLAKWSIILLFLILLLSILIPIIPQITFIYDLNSSIFHE
jgi:hypothetical protein